MCIFYENISKGNHAKRNRSVIYILKSCTKIIGINTATSINQPLWQNSNITVNKKVINWTKWKDNGITKLCHIFSNNCFKTFNELIIEDSIPKSEYLNYITLRHAIKKNIPTDKLNTDTHKFENVLFNHSLCNKNIVKMCYKILKESINDQLKI